MNSELDPQDQVTVNQEPKTVYQTTPEMETTMTEVMMGKEPEPKVTVEEFKISGDTLVSKVKELIHQGNIRRIIIKNEEGRTLIEIPMTIGVVGGVVGAAMFPVIAAIGAIGAVVAHLTVVVEKRE